TSAMLDSVVEAALVFAVGGSSKCSAPWVGLVVRTRSVTSGLPTNGMYSHVPSSAVKYPILPISGVPTPVTSLIASSAMAEPTTPTVGPSTPAWEQDGTEPGAGGRGKRSS